MKKQQKAFLKNLCHQKKLAKPTKMTKEVTKKLSKGTTVRVSKPQFGTSIINRCRSKELSMFIEKATRVARQLSTSKNREGSMKAYNRAHSDSFANRSTDFVE